MVQHHLSKRLHWITFTSLFIINWSYIKSGVKVGFTTVSRQNTVFILVLFINYSIIFHMNTVNLLLPLYMCNRFSILSHWLIYAYPSTRTTLSGWLWLDNISGSMHFPIWFLKNYLVHLVPLPFYLNFRISLSILIQHPAGDVIGLMLNLQISLKRIHMLTILRFSIHIV